MADDAEGSEGVAEASKRHKGRELVIATGMGHMVLQPPDPQPRRVRDGPEHGGGSVEGCEIAREIDGLGGFMLPCADDDSMEIWLGLEEETQHCGIKIGVCELEKMPGMTLEENGLACVSLWTKAVAEKLELLEICAGTESVEQQGIVCCCEVD